MLNTINLCIITVLFLYCAIFAIYFALIVIFSKIVPSKKKTTDTNEHKNLVVVIYSHNNEGTIVNLLEQLKKQNYPKGNYQIHIILDNCTDDSSNKLEFVGSAKLWRLNDDIPFGRDKAISWLLENLLSFKKVDAYVFLNANRIVKTDFLSCINEALNQHSVIVGSTEIFLENAKYYDKVFSNVNEYNVNIMKSGRAKLGLAVPIDSDITIIKHEVLEKVRCIDFKDANAELKYSFLLTSVNCPPIFVPEIKTYVSSADYEIRRPDFAFKMSLFKNCLNPKILTNFKFLEFLFSLFKPNPIVLIAILIIVGTYSFNYYFLFDFPWSIFIAFVLALAFGFSIYTTHLYAKPLLYLASCPFYTLADTISKTKICKFISKFIKPKKKPVIEKVSVPVNVTNGRNVFPCFLDLISEDGFKKAVFRYKNKKQETTQEYVRMCDAVKDITNTLEQHGFRMKICQSCAYFSPKIDGTNNMVKGYCNKKALEQEFDGIIPETLLWSTCEYFIPQEVNNVINIANYIKNK